MNRAAAALQAANSNRDERARKLRIGFFLFMALLMQLAFVISYTGAMHGPQRPHRMPVGVVAAPQAVQQLQKTADQAGPLFTLKPEASPAAAEHAVQHRDVLGAYVPSPAGPSDELLVTTALGPAAPQAMQVAFTQVAQAQQHTLQVRDVVPPHRGDPSGLVPFYLVIAWTVGGYLASTLVGLMAGMSSSSPGVALERIGLLAVYSVLGGIGGTLIVHTIMGFLGGSWWLQALIGTLLVFAVSVFANGLQTFLGLIGTGIGIAIFVILGNPSAAGPWPRNMIPAFWREIGPWLPNFQGTNAVRGVAYFHSQGLGTALWVLAAYAAIGLVLSVAGAGRDNAVLRMSEH
ncbi:MAG: DUF3533 domain-containing protein [Catenulispora sp.]|nr:DUF3533 domain-containing protein [Catenulispora sp.]